MYGLGVMLDVVTGWRHFMDNDVSWTLFIKMGNFSWTLSKGDILWTLFGDFSWTKTFRGHFCPREVLFLG
jgi:hypothetical protein